MAFKVEPGKALVQQAAGEVFKAVRGQGSIPGLTAHVIGIQQHFVNGRFLTLIHEVFFEALEVDPLILPLHRPIAATVEVFANQRLLIPANLV